MKDIGDLTIPQLEYLMDGFDKNSKEADKMTKGTLEGADAIQYLIDSGDLK